MCVCEYLTIDDEVSALCVYDSDVTALYYS